MLVSDLKPGDIFYGVSVSDPGPLEIDKIKKIYNNDTYVKVEVETIIGSDGGKYTFPLQYDLDKPLIAQYSLETIWIYCTNLDKIVEINEDLLNEKGFETKGLKWSVWNHNWV